MRRRLGVATLLVVVSIGAAVPIAAHPRVLAGPYPMTVYPQYVVPHSYFGGYYDYYCPTPLYPGVFPRFGFGHGFYYGRFGRRSETIRGYAFPGRNSVYP